MKKLVGTLGLDREEWLHYRKKGIGGSDAGAVCGMNTYRTAMQVYYDKTTDDIETGDNEAMRQGRDFEDYVARRFCEATGKKVRRANAMFYDENHPFMLADVDRMIVGENAGLECKTASPYMAEQWADGNIPISYQIQCYHYMSVCHADAWYIAVLIYGRDFKYYRLDWDDKIISSVIQIEEDFWENHVMARILPEPDGSKLADQVLAQRFRQSRPESIRLQGFDEQLQRRQELMELIERLQKEAREIDQRLKLFLGEYERAESDHYRVSWSSVCSQRLDEKRLKMEMPDVYEKYKKLISTRRFCVKAA